MACASGRERATALPRRAPPRCAEARREPERAAKADCPLTVVPLISCPSEKDTYASPRATRSATQTPARRRLPPRNAPCRSLRPADYHFKALGKWVTGAVAKLRSQRPPLQRLTLQLTKRLIIVFGSWRRVAQSASQRSGTGLGGFTAR